MEIAVLFVLILLNGVFAMSELALVSSKEARLKARADAGDGGAKAALKLREDPSRLLSAVQIGITLVGIVAGAYGATAIADDLAPHVAAALPQFARQADEAAFAIVIVLTTFLSLVFGELVPKRIAMAAPEPIASAVSGPMSFIATLAYPAVAVLRFSTEAILTVIGLARVKKEEVTNEEIMHLVEEGASSGAIGRDEKEMIEGVLELPDRNLRSIMTPRPEVVWLDLDDAPVKILETISKSGHSRFPVARGDIDQVAGIVQTKDVLAGLARSGAIDVERAMRKPLFLPETLSVSRLFEAISGSEVRMAVVVDEHGVFTGIVTAADMLGAIAGAAAFSPADRLTPAVRRDDGSWIIDGMTPIEDFERLLGVRGFDDAAHYSTVAGLLMHKLQRIPAEGDRIVERSLKLEVIDMDRRRIDKVLASFVTSPEEEGPAI
jgi:putative hemolysin